MCRVESEAEQLFNVTGLDEGYPKKWLEEFVRSVGDTQVRLQRGPLYQVSLLPPEELQRILQTAP